MIDTFIKLFKFYVALGLLGTFVMFGLYSNAFGIKESFLHFDFPLFWGFMYTSKALIFIVGSVGFMELIIWATRQKND